MSDPDIARLEEKLAFQEQAIQEMNEVLYRQQQEIDALREHNALLAERLEALKSSDGDASDAEQPPPHY
jgi:uncharacterized coiled-coil protein SlyX